MKPIPHGWLKYQALGQCVSGTRLLPFKVPLKVELCNGRIPEDEWFTPAILLQKQPRLKTIIDLTDTQRYYDPQEFESNGVTHIKINITGGGRLPPSFKIRQFFDAVDAFMTKYSDDPDALIGVHCTHGLNRTGYFICNYMVNRLKIPPEDAISEFQSARGYPIERRNYIDNIKCVNAPRPVKKPIPLPRHYNEYTSPLCGSYDDEPRRLDFRNGQSSSRDMYRIGVHSRRYNDQNYQRRDFRDPMTRQRNDSSHSNVDRNHNHGVQRFWRTHPYSSNSGQPERNSSRLGGNWRERP